jgi:DNA invertase Pin-like site-specific DNA recombinase
MRAAIYARVSTESQQQRGTIGSQLRILRERILDENDELIGEFCDDGHSGARLDRRGLDALRDAAEAGLIDVVWCLSPDRLARVYAYQVIVLDELASSTWIFLCLALLRSSSRSGVSRQPDREAPPRSEGRSGPRRTFSYRHESREVEDH